MILPVGLKNRVRVKLVKISNFFFRYNSMESAIRNIKIDKVDFHFHQKSSLTVKLKAYNNLRICYEVYPIEISMIKRHYDYVFGTIY